MKKVFWKSKTFWVSFFSIVAGVAGYFGYDISQVADGGTIAMVLGVVFMVLRFLTGVEIGIDDIPKPEKPPITK